MVAVCVILKPGARREAINSIFSVGIDPDPESTTQRHIPLLPPPMHSCALACRQHGSTTTKLCGAGAAAARRSDPCHCLGGGEGGAEGKARGRGARRPKVQNQLTAGRMDGLDGLYCLERIYAQSINSGRPREGEITKR